MTLTAIPVNLGVAGAHLAKGGAAGSPDLYTLLEEHRASIEALQGVTTRVLAKVATTAQKTLSGLAAIDGYTPVAGDIVLARAQDAGAQNGLYVAAAGAWTRLKDAAGNDVIVPNLEVEVERGTTYGDRVFHLTTNGPITVGSTALTFAMEPTSAAVEGAQADATQALANVGDLTTLTTTAKGSAVAALNEVNAKLQGGTLTLVNGTLTVNAGVVITANSRILLQCTALGAGALGDRYVVSGKTVGGADVGAFTVTATKESDGSTVATDVSTHDYIIIG